ncbi:MAG: hypothetical protein ACAI25_07015 [Planctomycetota bacterium]
MNQATDEKKRPSVLPLLACLLATILLLAELQVVVRYYKEVFDSMNVDLPNLTQLVLSLSDRLAAEPLLTVPVLGLVFVPWVFFRQRSTRVYVIATTLIVLVMLVAIPLTIFVPVRRLQEQLQSK